MVDANDLKEIFNLIHDSLTYMNDKINELEKRIERLEKVKRGN